MFELPLQACLAFTLHFQNSVATNKNFQRLGLELIIPGIPKVLKLHPVHKEAPPTRSPKANFSSD